MIFIGQVFTLNLIKSNTDKMGELVSILLIPHKIQIITHEIFEDKILDVVLNTLISTISYAQKEGNI